MSTGRVALSGTFSRNLIIDTGLDAPTSAVVFGDAAALDPGEVRLTFEDDRLSWPGGPTVPPDVVVAAARVNGQDLRGTTLSLPPQVTVAPLDAPTLTLNNDTGTSATDRITSDPALRVNPVSGAVGYEYRSSGMSLYAPLTAPTFVPSGLVQGPNTVAVRAIAVDGSRGPDVTITFTLDTSTPSAVSGLTLNGRTAQFTPVAGAALYEYRLLGVTGYATLANASPFTLPVLAPGRYTLGVCAMDVAGNVGPEATLAVVVAPPVLPVSATWRGQDGLDLVGPRSPAGADGFLDAHVTLANLKGPIAWVELRGGGVWRSDGTHGAMRLALVGAAGSKSMELYYQPTRKESGRTYQVTIRYRNGSTDVLSFRAGATDPRLRPIKARAVVRAVKMTR
jgi:hypothetical protein